MRTLIPEANTLADEYQTELEALQGDIAEDIDPRPGIQLYEAYKARIVTILEGAGEAAGGAAPVSPA